MVTYGKSKVWIDKMLKSLADGNEEINFEKLVNALEPFLICQETKAALSRQKIFILTKPTLVKAFQVIFKTFWSQSKSDFNIVNFRVPQFDLQSLSSANKNTK